MCAYVFYELEDVQVMSALALQESRERRETKLQVEIESGAVSLWLETWRFYLVI